MTKKRRWVLLISFLILALGLAACTSLPDPETSQLYQSDRILTLTPGHVAGQTFTSQRPKLDGLTLQLEPRDPDTTLQVSLAPVIEGESDPTFTTLVRVKRGANTIPLPPQPGPAGQNYILQLSLSQGEVGVLGRAEDAYPYGTASLDGQPLSADMAFQATYNYDAQAVLADLASLLRGLPLALPLILLLFVPGWLLLERLPLYQELEPAERVAVSIGLSLAFTPLVLLWTTTFNLRWYQVPAVFTAALMDVLFLWRAGRRLKTHLACTPWRSSWRRVRPESAILPAIFLLSLFIRTAMVRDLEMPAWVDSVHHALIAGRIAQNGAIPPHYLPHLPIEASRYHPGYHSLLVVFRWLTDLDLPDAMLVLGQVLNALTIVGVYLLATTLIKDRKAGWIAALITGALSLMPAYYTSWGRYTHLTGLLLLPVGLRWVLPRASRPPVPRRQQIAHYLVGGVLFAGLFLIHYRVLFFLILLIAATWIARFFQRQRSEALSLATSLRDTAILGFTSLLLALPWVVPALQDLLLPLASAWQPSQPAPLPGISWRYHTPIMGIPVMVLGVAGLVWGLYRRKWPALSLGLWVVLLFIFANPATFHLPFPVGFINQSSVEISLFMPLSILAGYGLSQVHTLGVSRLKASWVKTWNALFVVLGVAAALLGSQRLVASLNPATFLYREADAAGIAWLDHNLPPDEVIVINPAHWGYGLYMGQDGGFWISPLAGLRTMPPNVLYGLDRDNREKINTFAANLVEAAQDPARIWELMQECGLRYIYLGARGGVISPQALHDSPLFTTRYHQDGVWVFEALP